MKPRTRAIVLAAIIVVGAAEAGLVSRIGHAHHVADDNRAELAQTRDAFGDVEAKITSEQAARAKTQALGTERADEASLAQAAQDRDTRALAKATHNLAAAKATLAAAAASLASLDDCVNGAKKATFQRNGGDPDGAIATLRFVQPTCAGLSTPGDREAPVFPFDFSDPSVLVVGNTYYAYSTNSAMGDLPVISSTDLVHWTIVGNALPWLPAWATRGATWAPSVIPLGGRYVVFYTVRAIFGGFQCISVAVSSQPAGPFIDRSKGPLICDPKLNGAIDPQPFVDAQGTPWIMWKSDASNHRATIWSSRLRADGLALTGKPSVLIQADQAWEKGVVEAPSFVYAGGALLLFYSGNQWSTGDYALGEAHCASPAGPCWKPHNAPVFASHGRVAGPGSATMFTSPTGELWLAYNAYDAAHVGYPASRLLHIAAVTIAGDDVKVLTP